MAQSSRTRAWPAIPPRSIYGPLRFKTRHQRRPRVPPQAPRASTGGRPPRLRSERPKHQWGHHPAAHCRPCATPIKNHQTAADSLQTLLRLRPPPGPRRTGARGPSRRCGRSTWTRGTRRWRPSYTRTGVMRWWSQRPTASGGGTMRAKRGMGTSCNAHNAYHTMHTTQPPPPTPPPHPHPYQVSAHGGAVQEAPARHQPALVQGGGAGEGAARGSGAVPVQRRSQPDL